ncbi:TadE/TadG family type IV pilus assembly protein [Hyphococcus sp. DH-69]|uniref:TadE/TadG family type IV pilus assembly protein n=1 Tax=Hyphococcus formosus TaxID=3143534 RepID=UPI00398B2770
MAKSVYTRLCAFRKDTDGAAAIVVAILVPIVIAGLAFGAEAGYWLLQKQKVQNATDMAAYSAATQRNSGIALKSELEAVAVAVAAAGGYAGDDTGAEVYMPPIKGDYTGDVMATQLILTHSIPRRFSALFGKGDIQFTTMATARAMAGDLACVLALSPTASGAISIGGSTDVELDGCNISANSTSSSAIKTTGNSADFEAQCANTPGGVDDSHNVLDLDCGNPRTGTTPTNDPYAAVPEPTASGCSSFSDFSRKNRSTNPSPGCYTVSGNEKVEGDVNLSPGVYVFDGSGELRLNGNNSITGTGVTLYLGENVSVKVNGSFDLDIKAPTTGPYAGIAIYGARNNGGDMDLTGNAGVAVVGAIYAPSADVKYSGNSSGFGSGECTQVVGMTVEFWGSSEFDTDCSNSGTTDITTAGNIALVE